jgi:hypothetical protein
MVMMVLIFFLEEVGVDFRRVIEVKTAYGEHLVKCDLGTRAVMKLGDRINAPEALFQDL